MTQENQQKLSAPRSYRRDLMKAVGAGSALTMFGGTALADEHENGENHQDDDDEVGDETTDKEMEHTAHVVYTRIAQSTHPGRPADFFFEPTGLHIEPDDVVKFVFVTPDHTVTSYHPAFGMQRRVPAGVGPFSSPVLGWDPQSLPEDIDMPPEEMLDTEDDTGPGENGTDENNDGPEVDGDGPRPSTWLYSFDTPGVYDLECAPHEGFGMAMRIVVGEETETQFETSNPDELPPPRAGPVGLARQVLTDQSLEPDNIVESGRVEWADIDANQDVENGTDTENGDEGE